MDALDAGVIRTPLLPDPPASKQSLPLVRTKDKGGVRVVERGDWPSATSCLCWHCCHPFDGPPLPLPVRHDSRRDIFSVVGTFCSWPCVKAYNLDSSSWMRHVNTTIITLFHKRCTGTLTGIKSAPPRLALRAFGGSLTIEEFRKCETPMMILPPRMILHKPVVEEVPDRLRQRRAQQQLQDSISFKDTTTQNDMLRLRRPKPLPAHNLLVRTMGVQILQQGQ